MLDKKLFPLNLTTRNETRTKNNVTKIVQTDIPLCKPYYLLELFSQRNISLKF